MQTPPPTQRYWNRELETMGAVERERIILKKARELLRFAYDNSPYYHRLYHDSGLDIEAIGSLEEFNARVPITTRAMVRDEQDRYPPFGRIITATPQSASIVMASSGTTGKATYVPFSKSDLEVISDHFGRIMWSFGARPGMKIMIAATFSYYAGSWGVLLGAERLDLTVVPAGAGTPGMTQSAVRAAKNLKPDIIYGTPSYILHFLQQSRESGIVPSRDYEFKIVFGSGEPGLSFPYMKKRIKSELGEGVRVIDSGTMVEAMPWINSCECESENGPHLWQDVVYTEVTETKTGNGSLARYGGEGVLVYTSLDRRLYPLIRYFSNDVTTWTDEACPCGRTYPRLPRGIYGRMDDMIIVKGVKTWPVSIQSSLERSKWYNGEFRVILSTSKEVDVLRIAVEINTEAEEAMAKDEARRTQLQSEFMRLIRDTIGITAVIELASPLSLERSTHKARRIIDERPLRRELDNAKSTNR